MKDAIDEKTKGVKTVNAVTIGSSGSIWSPSSNYAKCITVANGGFPSEIMGQTSNIKFGDWIYTMKDCDVVIDFHSGSSSNSWFSEDCNVSEYTAAIKLYKDTTMYQNGKAYVIAFDVPMPVKIAYTAVALYPENIDRPCPSGGNEYLLRDVIEKYVSYLIKTVKESAISNGNFDNTDIEAMTITTPIGISSGQMMATDYNRLIKETMVNITGLPDKDVHIIAEPVAAAISYLYESDLKKKIDQEQTIMVFDLGGGTLDVTVVKHNPFAMTYDIVSKEGDLELGGMDWDHALGQLIMDRIGIASIEDPIERGAFWEEMTGLKISLSQRDNDVKP